MVILLDYLLQQKVHLSNINMSGWKWTNTSSNIELWISPLDFLAAVATPKHVSNNKQRELQGYFLATEHAFGTAFGPVTSFLAPEKTFGGELQNDRPDFLTPDTSWLRFFLLHDLGGGYHLMHMKKKSYVQAAKSQALSVGASKIHTELLKGPKE